MAAFEDLELGALDVDLDDSRHEITDLGVQRRDVDIYVLGLSLLVAALAPLPAGAASWEPTKNVEFVVPAGTGGGADQMARLIQGIVAKNNLMKHSIVVSNQFCSLLSAMRPAGVKA